jgi:HK97 gp10 family phage protein
MEDLARVLPAATHAVVMKTAFDIQADAQASMKGGGSPHHASQPGDPPNVDTGFLRGSVDVEAMGETQAMVGVGAEYGLYLEYGTSKMAARPFLTPAAKRHVATFVEACKRMLASWSIGRL